MPPAATAPRPPSGVGGRQNLSGPDVLEIFRTDKSTLYLILWPFPPPGHAIKMIQLKVNPRFCPLTKFWTFLANNHPSDDAELHRQLRRRSCRVRECPEEEAAGHSR